MGCGVRGGGGEKNFPAATVLTTVLPTTRLSRRLLNICICNRLSLAVKRVYADISERAGYVLGGPLIKA